MLTIRMPSGSQSLAMQNGHAHHEKRDRGDRVDDHRHKGVERMTRIQPRARAAHAASSRALPVNFA